MEIIGDVNITGAYKINNRNAINDTSNYVLETSNILVNRINASSNTLFTSINTKQGTINSTAGQLIIGNGNGITTTNNSLTFTNNDTLNAPKFVGNGSGLTNLPSASQWDGTTAISFTGNVGIGTTTNINNKLLLYNNDNNTSLSIQNYITPTTITISSSPSVASTAISGTLYKYMTYTYTTDTGGAGLSLYSINAPINVICDILVIGGGGGGVDAWTYSYGYPGGGGGAGALIYLQNYILPSGSYNIYVGKGGNGLFGASGYPSYISKPTYISNTEDILIRASGGGGGGQAAKKGGDNGGSGGGAGYGTSAGAAVSTLNIPSNLYGFHGADGYTGQGGGGGGSGGGGSHAFSGGHGGPGRQINITGTNTFYAAGGGGGGSGQGGSGIGGNGRGGGLTGTNGTANTGSGGGGGWAGGGDGGSGIVIIRYKGNEGNPEIQLASGSTIADGKIYKIGIYDGAFQIKTSLKDTYDNSYSLTLNNGNVGIGTINPVYKLHVIGTTLIQNLIVENTLTLATDIPHIDRRNKGRMLFRGNNDTFIIGGTDAYGSTNVAVSFGRISDTATIFQIYQNGNYTAAGSYQTWSDSRIKKEIEDINDDNALQMLLTIEPKTYKYIDGNRSKERVYGFIAQQVRGVIPEAVTLINNIIPNIYKNCICENKRVYVALPEEVLGSLIRIGDGGSYKIILVESDYIEVENYMGSKDIPYGEQFVYGYEVKDFHTINKEYIFTLNVCATQELHRRIEAQNVVIKSHEERIADLEVKVATLLNNTT